MQDFRNLSVWQRARRLMARLGWGPIPQVSGGSVDTEPAPKAKAKADGWAPLRADS